MYPPCPLRLNSLIAHTLLIVRIQNPLLVRRLEMVLVVSGSVSKDYLTWVLVGHDHTGHRQSASMGIRIVGRQLLPNHSSMLRKSKLVRRGAHGLDLRWLIHILIARWMLPPRLLQRIRNRDGLAVATNSLLNMRARAHLIVPKIDGWLVKFDGSEEVGVVEVAGLPSPILSLLTACTLLLQFLIFRAHSCRFWSLSASFHFFKIKW